MLSASNKFSFIMQNELSLQGIVMFIYENDLNQYVLFITRTNLNLIKGFLFPNVPATRLTSLFI